MRIGTVLLFLTSLISTSLVFAQKAKQPEITAEYQAFFDDLHAVMQKHPNAASRFAIVDKNKQTLIAPPSSSNNPRWLCCDPFEDKYDPPACHVICPM